MTDLQSFLLMISKSKEEFSKRKSGDGWVVKISNREIEFYFHNDESFHFCSADNYE